MTVSAKAPATIVLFDFDGTLLDSTPAVKAALEQACESLQASPPDPQVLDQAIAGGVLMGDLVRLIRPQADEDEVGRWLLAYRQAYRRIGLDHSALYPGAVELLAGLHRQGYRMAIVSNKSEPSIHVALQHFGLRDVFEHVWGEQPDLPGKPSPDLFHQRIRPCYPEAALTDFLMVGDTVADRDFAASSGIRFALVSYGYGQVELNADADSFRIHALAELPGHLPAPAGTA